MKYRKKPVIIEAVQWNVDNLQEILAFMAPDRPIFSSVILGELVIGTLEGQHKASAGDWIIKGVKGEFYPCKPDIFEQTYELAE